MVHFCSKNMNPKLTLSSRFPSNTYLSFVIWQGLKIFSRLPEISLSSPLRLCASLLPFVQPREYWNVWQVTDVSVTNMRKIDKLVTILFFWNNTMNKIYNI